MKKRKLKNLRKKRTKAAERKQARPPRAPKLEAPAQAAKAKSMLQIELEKHVARQQGAAEQTLKKQNDTDSNKLKNFKDIDYGTNTCNY